MTVNQGGARRAPGTRRAWLTCLEAWLTGLLASRRCPACPHPRPPCTLALCFTFFCFTYKVFEGKVLDVRERVSVCMET